MIAIDTRELANALRSLPGEFARASKRAARKAVKTCRTNANREVSAKYKVKKRDIDKNTKVYRERTKGKAVDEAELQVSGAIPAIAFKPKQTPTGVEVNITGKTVIMPHAFIQTTKRGHKGVYIRKEDPSRASGYVKRLPIKERYGVHVPGVYGQPDIIEILGSTMKERYPIVLEQELNYEFLKKTGQLPSKK